MYHFGIHVKKIIIIKNPANGKMIKIHNKILDTFMNMRKKFQDFWIKIELKMNYGSLMNN